MDISYSELRQHLEKTLDWTANNHEPVFITLHKKRKAVLMSYDDYYSLAETTYLLKSPANAKRLLQAVTDLEGKKNINKHDLIDEN